MSKARGRRKTKRSTRTTRRKQRGGALARRKTRLADKIAQGVSMGLSGPVPTFLSLFGKLGSQALKGVTDNVKHYRNYKRRRGGEIRGF